MLAALPLMVGCGSGQGVREHIHIVGSSTVYPFSTVVAEQFGQKTPFPTPLIESTGSGGGIKLFCAGLGFQHPDVVNSSRRIKASEVAACERHAVDDIVEVNIGYDGIVMGLSRANPPPALTRAHIFLALAKQVPDGDGLIDNPHRFWSDIDPALPNWEIQVFGPPPTSGTRDAFVELAMEDGCKHSAGWIAALAHTDERRFRVLCHAMREDGHFVEAGENDNLIVKKLNANPQALGIFGFSSLDQNLDQVQAAPVDGVTPTFANIANRSYPVSRPLYFYVKKRHVRLVPGLREFLAEFTGEDASGEFGYLSYRGLIPLADGHRRDVAQRAADLTPLRLPES
ncbi:MAG: substrate-binding domain-containing protein [Pseudomonadota bacterium]